MKDSSNQRKSEQLITLFRSGMTFCGSFDELGYFQLGSLSVRVPRVGEDFGELIGRIFSRASLS